MLSSLRTRIQKILNGVAGVVAPKVGDGAFPSVTYSIEEMIRYPPETKGIPVIDLKTILSSQHEILRLMHRDSGFPDSAQFHNGVRLKRAPKRKSKQKEDPLNFDTLFRQVVENYIKYVHLLPASENHHHSDVGGLIRHSLEVALHSFRKSQQQVLPAIGHLDDEQLRKPRWQYAAWVCGLLHDAGKILYDMRVYDVASGKDWNPYITDLLSWAKENKVDRYRVTWRPEHRHKKHENLTVQIIEWVLTPEAKAYLMDNSDELPIAINHTLSHFGGHKGYLQDCLRQADSASTEKDIRTQWHEMMGKRRYPLEGAIVGAMRRLRDNWDVNKPKGHVWIIGDDTYLSWPKSIQLIIQRLQDDNVDVPINPTKILEILEERNLVERLDDSVTYCMFTPNMNNVSSAERVIKLSWPGLLYETLPVPRSVSGMLRLNNEGKAIEYKEDGSVIEHAGDKANSEDAKSITQEHDSQESVKQEPVNQSKSNKKNPRKAKQKDVKDKPDKKTSVPDKADNSTSLDNGNKGLVFANQGEKEATTGNGASESKPASQANKSNSDELEVPDYLNNIDYGDDESLQAPLCEQGVEYLEDDCSANSAHTKTATKPVEKAFVDNKPSGEVAIKKASPASNLLRKRNVKSKSKKPNKHKWLGEKCHGRSTSDRFLIDFVTAMANGVIGIDQGQGVFLVNGQIHINQKVFTDTLNANVGKIVAELKADRHLDYDKFKPNLLVTRKEFGGKPIMVISLTLGTSAIIMQELGLSVTNVDYEAENKKPKPAITAKAKSTTGKKESTSADQPSKKLSGGDTDEITMFLKFLTDMSSEANIDYMQKTESGDHWAVFVQDAVKDFIKIKRKGANRNAISKELSSLADGMVDMQISTGTKKHLLLPQELIG